MPCSDGGRVCRSVRSRSAHCGRRLPARRPRATLWAVRRRRRPIPRVERWSQVPLFDDARCQLRQLLRPERSRLVWSGSSSWVRRGKARHWRRSHALTLQTTHYDVILGHSSWGGGAGGVRRRDLFLTNLPPSEILTPFLRT